VPEVTTAMVKELRDATGAGVMEAKRALEEAGGDMKRAAEILRERGIAAAAKRAGRETRQGVIEAYIHAGGRIGVLVELNCETDFVANTPEFRQLAKDIAMQIAAMNPLVIAPEDRTPEMEGPDEEIVLLKQPFIRDASKTIDDLVKDVIARTGENVRVSRFVRFELGK
jgi:elongation factor Ts